MSSIRKAKQSDVKRIWEIRTQAIMQTCVSHYAEDAVSLWAASPMPEHFDEILLSMGALVLEYQEEVVGFGFVDTTKSALEAIFVDPRFVGKGFGKIIAHELLLISKKADVRIVRLSSSLNAVKFYESLGFQAGEQTYWRHPAGLELGCIPMSKAL